ncbi:MAG: hypothetical protein FWE87_03000 [Coriobacteriia bacterium]|nr:hypothetical protein [Coriobacteriia bacterium]
MEKSTSRRRKLGIALAILLALALLLMGTFALVLPAQHGSNEFLGRGEADIPSVKLVDTFDPANAVDWQVGTNIDKRVSVLNDGEVPVYVKIQLKEYMDIKPLEATQFTYWQTVPGSGIPTSVGAGEKPSLFAIVDDPAKGEVFVVYNAPADASVGSVKAYFQSLGYVANEVAYFTEAANGQTGWFVVSEKGDINGQYGRYAYAEITGTVEGTAQIIGNVARADCDHYDAHDSDHECDECKYDIRKMNLSGGIDTTSQAFMQYISWILGADVVYINDWTGEAGDFWIIDVDGWVYWGNVLEPGDSTSAFMEKVALNIQPDGNFYYVIHIDMEACTDPRRDWGMQNNVDILEAWQPGEYEMFPIMIRIRELTVQAANDTYNGDHDRDPLHLEVTQLMIVWNGIIDQMEADGVDAIHTTALRNAGNDLENAWDSANRSNGSDYANIILPIMDNVLYNVMTTIADTGLIY